MQSKASVFYRAGTVISEALCRNQKGAMRFPGGTRAPRGLAISHRVDFD
jgi:hypothetical protein